MPSSSQVLVLYTRYLRKTRFYAIRKFRIHTVGLFFLFEIFHSRVPFSRCRPSFFLPLNNVTCGGISYVPTTIGKAFSSKNCFLYIRFYPVLYNSYTNAKFESRSRRYLEFVSSSFFCASLLSFYFFYFSGKL